MEEIEVKILEINRCEVEQKLKALGAKKVFDGELHILYFDLPDHSLRKKRITLRLRKEGSTVVLTVKTFLDSSIVYRRVEHEVSVSDFDKTRVLLEALGFITDKEMKKRRTSFTLPGVHVEIDQYRGEYAFIPEFLEIEGPDEETIFKHAELLGFTRKQCQPWSLKELVEHYQNSGTQ